MRGRKPGWSERGEKGGRPKGSFSGEKPGRKTTYKTFTVSCLPEEYEKIKSNAVLCEKSISRYLVDKALKSKDI